MIDSDDLLRESLCSGDFSWLGESEPDESNLSDDEIEEMMDLINEDEFNDRQKWVGL